MRVVGRWSGSDGLKGVEFLLGKFSKNWLGGGCITPYIYQKSSPYTLSGGELFGV